MLQRSSTAFLQGVIVFMGIGALALLLWEPHLEGRNARATVFEVYFKDPFLAFVYVGSLPFFLALYHGFQVLGCAGRNQAFSPGAVKSLHTIKLCAIVLIGFVAIGEVLILMNSEEDKPGGIFMGLMIAGVSMVIGTAAATFEQILRNAVDLKSENDLTV